MNDRRRVTEPAAAVRNGAEPPRGDADGPSARAAATAEVGGDGSRCSVAIFDLDGTLVVGQTQLLLVRFLRKRRVVTRSFVLGTALWFVAYKAGLVKVSQASRAKGAEILTGLTEEVVRSLMVRFTTEVMVPRLHPAATAALAEHQAEGDLVVVVSAALEPLVQALCDHLQVADYAGARCEIAGGRYTGRLLGPVPYAEEKARVAARFISDCGADAADCWAYADHDTDLALLRSVGHPVAVNPRPGLRSEAERNGWPILLSKDPNEGGARNG